MTRKTTFVRPHAKTVLSLCALTLFISASLLYAGPINPPAGPVTSTYKTLSEVEPRIAINSTNTPGDSNNTYTISQSGSYYLTGNLTGEALKNGIRVMASNVTIDLNGFQMNGVATSLDGIVPSTSTITVRNGVVRNWATGVNLRGSARVFDVQANSNRTGGISVGTLSEVHGCTASNNLGNGIAVSSQCIVSGCIVDSNSAMGFSLGGDTIADHCVARLSGGTGIGASLRCQLIACASISSNGTGISIGQGSSATDCTVTASGSGGMNAGASCVLTGCTVQQSITTATPGIIAGEYSILDRCVSTGHFGAGMALAQGCKVVDCVSSNNGSDGYQLGGAGSSLTGCSALFNSGSGFTFTTGQGATFNTCTARGNLGDGFNISFYVSIIDCNANSNGLDGIRSGQGCIIRGNTCNGNGTDVATGAGIHCTGSDCRVEANQCNQNDRGIDIDAAGNFITRNACAGNVVNYDTLAGNVILVINATIAPAFAGSAGGVAPGSTDPNANFSY